MRSQLVDVVRESIITQVLHTNEELLVYNTEIELYGKGSRG
jgi:hypothetical protein